MVKYSDSSKGSPVTGRFDFLLTRLFRRISVLMEIEVMFWFQTTLPFDKSATEMHLARGAYNRPTLVQIARNF
jgi:hypothetical protein